MTGEHAIAFFDLTRFTALNDVHGDDAAVDVLERFTATVHAEIEGRGRIVKSLGDGVLLDFADPASAIAAADGINRRLHATAAMPEFTGGIATGPVVDRDGDVLGSTVNLASRLADLAPAGELRVTEASARAASAQWQVEPLGPVDIRGFHEPLLVFRVVLCHPHDHTSDPVCGMRITPGPNTPTRTHDGTTWWFCSPGCADRFDDRPSRYAP